MSKSSANSAIRLRGVRHNNLKNFDLDLPLNRLIVVTGLSGSGKSSLAFDTLFAEGQRRYIETFSPYARQFFDRMDKPKVDSIEGIPPAIAIEQRNSVRSTRSTVGTMTEICDYMKVLWPHIAQLHCRQCNRPVRKDSPQQIWNTFANSGPGTPNSEILITFDLPLTEKIPLEESLGLIAKQGYQRLLLHLPAAAQTGTPSPHPNPKLTAGERKRPDSRTRTASFGSFEGHAEETTAYGPPGDPGLALNEAIVAWGNQKAASNQFEIVRIDEATDWLKLLKPSSLTVVQDRVKLAAANRARFVEACEQAYHFGKGKLAIHLLESDRVSTFPFSNRLHCADCDIEYRGPLPAMFSFNHPLGACPACRGFGRIIGIDYNLAVPNRARTLAEGAVKPWLTGHGLESQRDLMKFCKIRKVPTDVPFERLPRKLQDWVIRGDPDYGKDKDHEWPRAWYGVKGYFRWLESKAYKMHVRVLLSRYRSYTPCPDCGGKRFQPESLLYSIVTAAPGTWEAANREKGETSGDANSSLSNSPPLPSSLSLADFYQLPIRDALQLIERIAAKHQPKSSDPMGLVLSEVRSRLGYLTKVGLGYLTLDRPTRTLSGGETERVNLTTCLGTRLVNTLYVLDEPSVGLHPRDTGRLIKILEQLRDLGNTVVVVEHEASVIRAADQIVDLGPGHGESGGQLVFQGSHSEILKSKESLTGQYLSGRKRVEVLAARPITVATDVKRFNSLAAAGEQAGKPASEPPAEGAGTSRSQAHSVTGSRTDQQGIPTVNWLAIQNASLHNLQNLDVEIPLARFVCVTGVSGSGKTTLVREVLLPALQSKLNARVADQKASDRMKSEEEKNDDDESPSTLNPQSRERCDQISATITGWEHIGDVVLVDQSALGKTPRSNPAVYVGAFDEIREFFAQTDAARQRGLNASAFSFNSAQGQCERCRGAGFEKIEMQFLSDVFIRCPACEGRRYRPHILEVKVSGPSSVVGSSKVRRARSTDHGPRTTNKSLSIADVLDATVDEGIVFLSSFSDSRPARRAVEKLKLLQEVGLGYLRLGQPINTLSGGESQRLKLVSHLAESEAAESAVAEGKGRKGERERSVTPLPPFSPAPFHVKTDLTHHSSEQRTLFLFDEPTTGLHFDDVRVLLKVFHRLVDAGHSVIVVEHNLDVIKCADWVIDLGPEAGDQGGQLVAQGKPEDIAACEASHTGEALREASPPLATRRKQIVGGG
jgi:excinuclease ABC subunit A